MLNSIQRQQLHEIEDAPDSIHWIEKAWIDSFKRKFEDSNSEPCLATVQILTDIWKKAQKVGLR